MVLTTAHRCSVTGARSTPMAVASSGPKWSTEQLADFSAAIVTGRVRAIVTATERHGGIYTYVSVDITEVLKGSIAESQVVLKQAGGDRRRAWTGRSRASHLFDGRRGARLRRNSASRCDALHHGTLAGEMGTRNRCRDGARECSATERQHSQRIERDGPSRFASLRVARHAGAQERRVSPRRDSDGDAVTAGHSRSYCSSAPRDMRSLPCPLTCRPVVSRASPVAD